MKRGLFALCLLVSLALGVGAPASPPKAPTGWNEPHEQRVQLAAGSGVFSLASTADGSGALRISIRGLPAGVEGRVIVRGPEGYVTHVGASSYLGHLQPGMYEVSATRFSTTDGSFRPRRQKVTVDVPGQASAPRVVVRYRRTASGPYRIPPIPRDPSARVLQQWLTDRGSYTAWSDFDPLSASVQVHSRFSPGATGDVDWWDPNPVVFRTQVPSGIYTATLPSGAIAPVVVSTNPRVQRSQVAVIIPDFTWQAYNDAGGWSMYVPTPDRPVSLKRPLQNAGEINISVSSNPLDFLRRRYGPIDVIAQSHLHHLANDYDLSKYRLLILYGHDEYWTKELRSEIESAVTRGTNLLNMSGGTMWWRLEVAGNLIRRTTNWYATAGEPPEEDLLGVSFRYAGYPLSRTLQSGFTERDYQALVARGFPTAIPVDQALRYTDGMRVIDPSSPLLSGTGLSAGDWFGVDSRVSSGELDGLPLTPSGRVDLSAMPLPPAAGTHLVAEAFAEHGRAATVVDKDYGAGHVVSLGSIGWMRALLTGDAMVTKITDNAFAMLTQP